MPPCSAAFSGSMGYMGMSDAMFKFGRSLIAHHWTWPWTKQASLESGAE